MQAYRDHAAALWRGIEDAVSAFMAEAAMQGVLASQPACVLRIAQSESAVLRMEGEGLQPALTAAGRPQDAVKSLVNELGPALGKDCAVEIASGLSLTSRMILPAESDEIIKAILRNKVESIAPWPLAQSLYGQRVLPVPGDPAHVAADVGVVSRALLEEIAAQLAAAGTTVKAASLMLPDGESLRLDFGSQEESLEAQRRGLRLAGWFAAAAGCVALLGLLLAWSASARLAAEREEMAALSASLAPGAEGGGASIVEAANILHERRRQRAPAVEVLNELSEILPQSVWLGSLSLEDARLEIKGQGSDIPSLIDVLEQSAAFRDVNFSSATQFDAERNQQAFSIGATLEPAGERTP